MNKIYVLLTSLLLLGCDWGLGPSYDPTSETAYVDYYKEACDSTSTNMCMRMRFDTADDFVLSSVPNVGFDNLEWGKRYTVQVEVEYDSSGDHDLYSLLSVSNEEAVDPASNPFVLTFSMSSQILLDNLNSSWIIAGEDVFACSNSDCALLTNAYNASEQIQLEFSAIDDQLTLLTVACSAAENDFASNCEGVNKANWDIAHYQTDCGLFDPKLCYVYRDNASSDDTWYVFHYEITDFTAEWGTEYDIQVEAVTTAGSVRSATWLKENSQQDLSADAFNVVMRTGVKGLEKSNAGVLSYDGIEFNCAINFQCDAINNVIDSADSSSDRILALLTHAVIADDNTVLLAIESITCDASSDEFKENCADEHDEIIWFE
jgi:hypothetical protein